MIKFGYCSSTSADKNDPLGLKIIPILVKYGFDFIELPLWALISLNDDEWSDVVKLVRETSLNVYACNLFMPGNIKLTGASVSNSLIEDYLTKVISRVSVLGVEIIVLGSAGARNIEDDTSKETATAQLRDFLIMASEMFEPHGIKIAIESLNKKESNILNSLTEAAYLTQLVNRKNVGLLADLYHMDVENEPVEVISELYKNGADFFHCHIADITTNRGFPLKSKNFTGFATALKAINYTGGLSIEGSSQNINEELSKAKTTLDALFKN